MVRESFDGWGEALQHEEWRNETAAILVGLIPFGGAALEDKREPNLEDKREPNLAPPKNPRRRRGQKYGPKIPEEGLDPEGS